MMGTAHGAGTPSAGEIDRLLKRGQSREAYELALRRAVKEAGNPDFDFAFARAAIAEKQFDQAVFALERVVLSEPDNHAARLEFARTELALGNTESASAISRDVLARHPPEPIRSQANELTAQIDWLIRKTTLHAYVEAKYGYDTNINSASNLTSVGILAPAPSQVANTPARKDHFKQLEFGIDAEQPLAADSTGFASLSGYVRDNDDSDAFDTRSYDIRAGAVTAQGRHSLRLTGQWQQYYLDNHHYRRMWLLAPDWSVRVTPSHQLLLFGQVGVLDYPRQTTRDADLRIAGFAWAYSVDPQVQLMISAYHGDERTGGDDGTLFQKYLGRSYNGWRVRGQWDVSGAHLFYLGTGGQSARHDEVDPLFLAVRKDDLDTIEAGWHWRLAPAWTLKAEAYRYRNDSNIALYEYSRTLVQIGMRYTFF
jgi:outer membrane protein